MDCGKLIPTLVAIFGATLLGALLLFGIVAEQESAVCDVDCQLLTQIVGTNEAIETAITASETAVANSMLGTSFAVSETAAVSGLNNMTTVVPAQQTATAIIAGATGTQVANLLASGIAPAQITATAIIGWATQTQLAIGTAEIRATRDPNATLEPCYFNWHIEELPEITAEVEAAFEEAGIENIGVTVSAVGEDCIGYESNSVQYFAAMETEFYIDLLAEDDRDAMAEQVIAVMDVLDQFLVSDLEGPNPGRIIIVFGARGGSYVMELNFQRDQYEASREEGLTGGWLLESLRQ